MGKRNKLELGGFREKVLTAVQLVPRGRVTTYGELARFLGQPKAARAVGQALKRNPRLEIIPCHRVVRVDGSLGGYVAGQRRKEKLLQAEGIKIKNKRVENFSTVFFCYRPLAK